MSVDNSNNIIMTFLCIASLISQFEDLGGREDDYPNNKKRVEPDSGFNGIEFTQGFFHPLSKAS